MDEIFNKDHEIINMIKLHIDGMLNRQRRINMQMRELQTKFEMIVEEKAELESTLFKIEKSIKED